ncbi:MAG: outer membrane protein assembly factor BamC [Pseudomonadota bacterium]
MNSAIAPTRLLALTLALSLAGCASFENMMSGDKVDYRGQSQKSAPLEVPPDLSQLAREGRYQPQTGVVSASTLRQPNAPAAVAATAQVAPNAVADMRIERQGNVRYLVTGQAPEQLYPLVRSFWQERGFSLAVDNPEIGMMETDWAENRAKLPQDVLRRTLGRVIEGLYSTPERDRFRTRIERTATGSEVYISHRGLMELYTSEMKDATMWQPRPTDPELEAEFLSRLMVKLGAKEETARATVAAAPVTPARARSSALPATGSAEVADTFDRTWRQVGLALDRSGFTVEDRDRSAGLYFVRYIDPKQAGQDEPNFFSKLFGGGKDAARPQRVRVLVKANGAKTAVTVQTADGNPDNSEQARTIIGKLLDEMR